MANPSPLQELLKLRQRPALELVSTADRGIPGRERVYLKTNSDVRLREHLLLAGVLLPNRQLVPLRNHMLWLGDHDLDRGYWVVVYSGPGQNAFFTQFQTTKEPALVLHWGHTSTIFNDKRVVPCVIRIDALSTQFGGEGF